MTWLRPVTCHSATISASRPPRVSWCARTVTNAQLNTLSSFIANDLGGGTLPFTVPAPRNGGTWLVRLGESMPSWENVIGDRYNVSMVLEVLP